jgi:hypothetical protein
MVNVEELIETKLYEVRIEIYNQLNAQFLFIQ